MQALMSKNITDPEEHILKYTLKFLNLLKIPDDKFDKVRSDDNIEAIQKFLDKGGFCMYLFAMNLGNMVGYTTETPSQDKMKNKMVLCLRARPVQNKDEPVPIDMDNIGQEIIMMEVNKQILDNLYAICNEVYSPVLSNPLNMMGWSDLVSKDLMQKFNVFLAHTFVTIGQVKGRTWLPLPPSDATSSEKSSSKDKAQSLEGALLHWTRQIKNVLKQDPESALKSGNNPDPLTEIQFWKDKSENLNSICEQLSSERIKKVLKFLEQNKSTYTGPFSKLQKEVQTARTESNENYKYLQTLQDLFHELTDNSVELAEAVDLFIPIMHTTQLIWNYSNHYNTPSRLVVLIREICNAIINRCRNYIDGPKIFAFIQGEEPGEAHEKLILALDVCSKFKDAYFEYKAQSKNQWKITTNALFVRLDSFSERCQDIKHLTQSINHFSKLQRIEIGNTKGKTLTQTVDQIFEEFQKAVNEFMEVKYDIMNIDKREFEEDFYKFKQRIKELERRLASILTQAFDDCDTIAGKFKLLDSFEGLLNRPNIQDELEKKHINLLELYKQDLKCVASIFMEGKVLVDREKTDSNAPISANMPPISGALAWTSGLLERIKEPMAQLMCLSQSIQDREEYKDVQKLYASLCNNLNQYNQKKIKLWEEGVEVNTESQLNKFLLYREDTPIAEEGFVRVNFDPILIKLLREVKYLLQQDVMVPEKASLLYKKVNVYRTQTGNLQIIVDMYNGILSTLLPVEKPLLQDRIERMNKALFPGINELKWNSQNIDPFINSAMSIVKEVDELVKKMKDNISKMQDFMLQWKKPLFERKMKPQPPDELIQFHESLKMPRLEDIKNHGKEIQKLMKDTAENIKPDKKKGTWLDYLDYVNGLVIQGITTGIEASMEYLANQININYNRHHQLPPMFDIKVDLRDRDVVFDPSIQTNSKKTGIRDLIQGIMDDFISIAIQINRLDSAAGNIAGDFLVEIKDQFTLFGSMQIIAKNFEDIQLATMDFINQYRDKEFLWKETLEESFQAFLDTGIDPREQRHVKINDEGEEEEDETFKWMSQKILCGVETKRPNLEAFDEKITFLTKTKNEIALMKTSVDIGWLRVNVTPLIKELQNTVTLWIDRYTSFLLDNTHKQIENIDEFIQSVKTGIRVTPEGSGTNEDKELLMKVMTHLSDVKQIKDRTLEQIEPMKETVLLLKKHQLKMDTDLLVHLENSKTVLVEVSQDALGRVKEKILPFQTKEASNIKDRLRKFEIKVGEFRLEFQNECPYNVQLSDEESIFAAYTQIELYYEKTLVLEQEAEELNNLEILFDIQKSTYKQLKDCRTELVLLKYMWDMVALVQYQFDNWQKTLWDKIDTENLMQLIKDMQTKQCSPVAAQNKDIKNWRAFTSLVDKIKNMNTILPLISQLHSKFMMERHWKKLMKITQKEIAFKSPQFCLQDLIELQLFNYSEEVTEIVDGAQKEDKIEKKLNTIQKVWETSVLIFKDYKEVPILGVMDEIIENQETHSMELMAMMSSKDVEEFKDRVMVWQGNMKTVDNVMTIWMEVQRNWMKLQPIFCDSEDIRAQLPDDSRKFEQVDQQFREVMREAQAEPSVINACTYDGREEILNTFAHEIETCEKALNEYLEQKKKIFSRFYFVSNQNLLDILSNGQNPEKVDEFIGDCFDGLKNLRFEKGPGYKYPSKVVEGMISNEGEYVDFSEKFECVGAVENYLCDLERMMQKTLRDVLEVAKTTADSWDLGEGFKKRHEWLEDYCAQISLLGTQIIWTEETIRQFDDMDGGSENAMKDYAVVTKKRINDLIERVRVHLDDQLRVKVITIITIDVHERDVIDMFVARKIADQQHFQWQSQLKFYIDEKQKFGTLEQRICTVKICDWLTRYNYEYVGNCGRLVITPLTDRCYITLTQALNLSMGGAPAGPAGTGKTETTKDLARALGVQCVVFNCSDQMTYQTTQTIFMGLAQCGSWGCFDEFNRISIEVLSVVSTQVKYVLDAILVLKTDPAKNTFLFFEEEIGIKITVGFWITMNPGYAGRTELPENLKALFRSCAMVVPDIVLICENMLMSEGFSTAKELSKKFMCLYDLSKSLLSKQMHYDWGLRAVKSVLRQAGGLKRNEPDVLEDIILMRGLRDFNIPKIVLDDQAIFKGLIDDLFPGIKADPQTDLELATMAEKCAIELGYQADEGFVLKVVQLAEILVVRHCCFIIGSTGCSKSSVWKTLKQANTKGGRRTQIDIIDPKAIVADELYGFMNLKTNEWKDGVLSVIMRDMNKAQNKYADDHEQKWVILDGDVDPEWIESLNTVMDDNKVLTLVSQERIPMTGSMRLILEVSNLRSATPATVSRGGVLFINDADIGWKPFFDSWLMKYKKAGSKGTYHDMAENVFTLCLTTYVSDSFLDDLRHKQHIAPVVELGHIDSLTTIIDQLCDDLKGNKKSHDFLKKLKEENKEEEIKAIYEGFFLFAGMWAFGASLNEDKNSFSNAWKSAAKIKFPETGMCFDYYFDYEHGWLHWDTKVAPFNKEYDGLYINIIVPTADTTRQKFLLDLHVKAKKGMMYVGTAGTGKSIIIKNYFNQVDPEQVVTQSISMNSYTDSQALQVVIESQVDKLSGTNYGPQPGRTLIYFMDDVNMPKLDKYFTQSPICLVRQIIDYGLIYNRDKLSVQMQLHDVMFAACMNPKSGSFNIDIRLSRHFTMISCLTTERIILNTIYLQVLNNHYETMDKQCSDLAPKIINATMNVFLAIANSAQFAPTAIKFHYQFNLRDFARIIQNMLLAMPQHYKGNPLGIVRMWAHECHRTWHDRLIFDVDREAYMNFMRNGIKEFGDFKEEQIFEEPLLYTSFVAMCGGHEATYLPVAEMVALKGTLEAKLEEYNEVVARMDLVLFDQAMEHISRIARITIHPVGSALLVGVGGSGKQSLAKLTAFILGYDVVRIMVTTSYKLADLKVDIQTMFTKAGVAGAQLMFILTDGQISDNKFLMYINDLLASGYVPELFLKDELDGILGKVRGEAKANGFQDTPDQLFEFFLDKTRKNLHLALCFSPVGDAFRIRARMFPGIINCTSMDYFFDWPEDALINVANRFLVDVELPNDELREAIAQNMATTHLSIAEANQEFLEMERRHNYTTPTSFLELINFYKSLLGKKIGGITDQIERLEFGLGIMQQTTEKVDGLSKLLEIKMKDVEIEKEKTDKLIEVVTKESGMAEKEAEAASVQATETELIANAAKKKKADADAELADAIPAMEAATKAVDCLTKDAVQELKNLGSPPAACVDVAKAGLILLKNEKKNYAWQNAQKMMNNPNQFIDMVRGFDGNNIDDWKLKACEPLLALDFFNFEVMKGKSTAAAYLCAYVVNIIKYNSIYKKVKPLKDGADEAEALAAQKLGELQVVKDKVAAINAEVQKLKDQLFEAQAKKQAVEDEAKELMDQLDLANRLVNGLADENVRWGQNVITYKAERVTMIGDALLASAFVSYIGPFSYKFRLNLWSTTWMDDIIAKKIPYTAGIDPLNVLSDAAMMAVWAGEGLPADRVSIENAAIVVSCTRYPLLIDPQLQGQKWIRGKEGGELVTIQLTQKAWLKKVEMAVSNGQVLLIESIGQDIDAILDPLLSRQFVKKGKNYTVRLGSEDVEISNTFKLYLQTKLINPHYKPETAAQCTIINFIVTESGLEDQLLAMVVRVEKPDLEQTKEELVNKQNQFKITLNQLESNLLNQLSNADPKTILQNTALIESLEDTKKTSAEIQEQQAIAKETEKKINFLREIYRRVAAEGAMLYFMLITLNVINHMYQYSLESFTTFFFKAIEKAETFEEEETRVLALRAMIRITIYQWVARGLFEAHKPIVRAQLTFRLMQKKIINVEYTDKEMMFLLQCPSKADVPNPLKDWLPDLSWFAMQKLIEIEGFDQFAAQVEKEAPTRFKDWYNELAPEDEKLPLEWKKLDNMLFQKLLVIRVLRPDRVTTALDNFVRKTLPVGDTYVDCDATSSASQILVSSYQDSTPTTPIYFILSPGANPVQEVENLGRSQGVDIGKKFHQVALGQGQDKIAHNWLDIGHKEGHWVMLQNIHLMPGFLKELEKKLDGFAMEGSNPEFRLYLTSDPSNSIPIGLLERCIKLTNEPPEGLKANMKRAFAFFQKEEFDEKEAKIKCILFALCYFHSVMLERRKFGPKGWNMRYAFAMGDLRDSAIILNNYMETGASSGKIPWDDLKYLFGEIMYGGHIVDGWDRVMCKALLDNLMTDELTNDEKELFPFLPSDGKISFKSPPLNQTYDKYAEYIETDTPPETPLAFGMHPNAEIDFRTMQCMTLFKLLQEIQPRDASSGGGGGGSMQEKVQEFMVRVNDEASLDTNKLNIEDIVGRINDDQRGPYQNSFLQECEVMNVLIKVIVSSLKDVELAFKGELTMTANMETLMEAIFFNQVPATWAKFAFPSSRGLGSWLDNCKQRLEQLNMWKENPSQNPPLAVCFVNRLFNPQSFLTATKQIFSKEKQAELNKLDIQTDVLKKLYWEPDLPPIKEGAYVFGFQIEGARWDPAVGQLEESFPKKPFSVMPVVNCRAVPLGDGKEDKSIYKCPVYKTIMRSGLGYVFTAQLKTKFPPDKWVLAGVSIILDVEGVSDAFGPGKETPLQ